MPHIVKNVNCRTVYMSTVELFVVAVSSFPGLPSAAGSHCVRHGGLPVIGDSQAMQFGIDYHSEVEGLRHPCFERIRGRFVQFAAPLYAGEFPTKIRACLACKRTPKQKKEELLYSNEIDGSVNPGQFWRKELYTPTGVMDPYSD